MDISIIIVSYNVKYFLEQCLRSVYASKTKFKYEVWVVDNNSSDGSIAMVRSTYPNVNIISNQDNVGFAKANNQAFRQAQGRYLLMLNPDTILQGDTLMRCGNFLEENDQVGAVGVRMIDGSGNFLPESKRGLPTPAASFFKMSGIYKIAPRSKRLNAYYRGDIGEMEVADVEVLSGAFMFMRRDALQTIDYLDEDYFMYGEDIDLSYRISLAGYRVVYLGDNTIIHFKGESTRKATFQYHRHFHRSMLIFSEKHFAGSQSALVRLIIRTSIYLRGMVSYTAALLRPMIRVLVALMIVLISYLIVSLGWTNYYFDDINYLPESFYRLNMPLYTTIIIFNLFLFGAFFKHRRIKGLSIAAPSSLLMLLALYALLPNQFRSSRVILLLGWMVGFLCLFGQSWLKKLTGKRSSGRTYRSIWVGSLTGYSHIQSKASFSPNTWLGFVSVEDVSDEDKLGTTKDLEDIISAYRPDQIIFERRLFDMDFMMACMTAFGQQADIKLYVDDKDVIIGSKSKNRPGEIETLDVSYRIRDPYMLQWKRSLDLFLCCLALLTIPVVFFVHKSFKSYLRNILGVLQGHRTWVGYIKHDDKMRDLPKLLPGVLEHSAVDQGDKEKNHRFNFLYARDYTPGYDLVVFFKQYKSLDQ